MRNKLFAIACLAFTGLSVAYLVISFCNYVRGEYLFKYVYTLWQSNTISIISFVFFLLLSYEFCYRVYADGVYETIKCTKKEQAPVSICNFAVLFFFNLIYSLVILLYNYIGCLAVGFYDSRYFVHILVNILVNFLLTNTFAILFGQAVSFFRNRVAAYLCIIVYMVLASVIGYNVVVNISLATDVNFVTFIELFSIFPPNLDWTPMYAMGYSVLPYRIFLLLAWALVSLTVVLCCCGKKRFGIKQAASVALAIVCVVLYAVPQSKVDMGTSPRSEANADQMYYEGAAETAVDGNTGFAVLNYVLDMEIGLQLSCTATITPDRECEEYLFTLYHGYKVKDVVNQDGEELKFERDGDYINVHALGDTKQITMRYSGNGKGFYSNYQGLYLAGDFPYYPVAGKHEIYGTKVVQGESERGYLSVMPNEKTEFEINVKSKLKVYSNLEGEENSFKGKTNAPCLFAGMYVEKEYMGCRVIYPYLDGESIYIDENLQKMSAENEGKTIFIEPHVNIYFAGEDEEYRNYEDVVLIKNIADLAYI